MSASTDFGVGSQSGGGAAGTEAMWQDNARSSILAGFSEQTPTAPVTFFDCENPANALRLSQALSVLAPLRGLVVIDEAQRLPELFPVRRVLLDRPDWSNLTAHPKFGASWEGFVIEHLIHLSGTRDAYFWATHGGAELDLLLFHRGRRIGFEVKFQDAPTTTKSMHIALSDLKLDRLFVVYPGTASIPLTDQIECLPFTEIAAEVS